MSQAELVAREARSVSNARFELVAVCSLVILNTPKASVLCACITYRCTLWTLRSLLLLGLLEEWISCTEGRKARPTSRHDGARVRDKKGFRG